MGENNTPTALKGCGVKTAQYFELRNKELGCPESNVTLPSFSAHISPYLNKHVFGGFFMKLSGNVDNGTRNRNFNFGGESNDSLDPQILKTFCTHKQYSGAVRAGGCVHKRDQAQLELK